MGKVIGVSSFEEMERASKSLKEISEAYTTIYKRLMEDAGTMGSAWEGADNLAFVEQINGFAEELQAMADKIMSAGEALDQQRRNYMARQEDNVAQVRKLTN